MSLKIELILKGHLNKQLLQVSVLRVVLIAGTRALILRVVRLNTQRCRLRVLYPSKITGTVNVLYYTNNPRNSIQAV